eukprot:scaffold36942_cov50-Phaeocystis_antarctica.AAC.1
MIGPTGKAACLTRGPRWRGRDRSPPAARPKHGPKARPKARPRHRHGPGHGPRHGRGTGVQWFRAALLGSRVRWRHLAQSAAARTSPAPHPHLMRHASRVQAAARPRWRAALRSSHRRHSSRSSRSSLTPTPTHHPHPNPKPQTPNPTLTLTPVQVEATKFTEVGFVGKDVDQIIRDLVDVALALEKTKASPNPNPDPNSNPPSLALEKTKARAALPLANPNYFLT